MTLRQHQLTAINLIPLPTIETCGIHPDMLALADAVIVIDEPAPGVARLTHVKSIDPAAPPREPILLDMKALEA